MHASSCPGHRSGTAPGLLDRNGTWLLVPGPKPRLRGYKLVGAMGIVVYGHGPSSCSREVQQAEPMLYILASGRLEAVPIRHEVQCCMDVVHVSASCHQLAKACHLLCKLENLPVVLKIGQGPGREVLPQDFPVEVWLWRQYAAPRGPVGGRHTLTLGTRR